MSARRLAPPYGLLLDRSTQVDFTFEGQAVSGLAGDTIASALAAQDIWLLSRSFKYHRPRGVLSLSGDDANTFVQLPDEPNVLADTYKIQDGLAVSGQHYSGSLRSDAAQRISAFSRFLPVGFYYHAFHKPRGIWDFWEKRIRARAGLGAVNQNVRGKYYDKAYACTDVAVIGAGAAGVSAAVAAAKAGRDVTLIERQPILGGSLNHARLQVKSTYGVDLARELAEELTAAEHRIAILADALCTGLFADNLLSVMRDNRLIKLRAEQVILATGAIEQPAVFENNDLPGVMMASAAQRLLWLYAVRPGRDAVILTANADGYGAALDLAEAGVTIRGIVELRDEPTVEPLMQEAVSRRMPVLRGYAIRRAFANEGGHHLAGIELVSVAGQDRPQRDTLRISCDLICMSVGWAPAASLAAQAGAEIAYNDAQASFDIRGLPDRVQAVGALTHRWTPEAATAQGRHAGLRAAGQAGEPPPGAAADAQPVNHPFPYFPGDSGKAFVDFDEDLTPEDIENSVAEGFDHVELVKRYSTVGMGPSQGRQSAANTVRLLSRVTGRSLNGSRGWTNRPPAYPEKVGQLAGRGFEPVRQSPMHDRHLQANAEMMAAGAWLRPAFYGPDRDTAIEREVSVVRGNAGLIDVSTLGGIELRGPDAAAFLERVYTGRFETLKPGRSRYALMCDMTGTIQDDGMACRFAADHFYVTATTGNSDEVHRAMLWWNAQWGMDVDITNVTGAYAAVNIAGPQSRSILAPVCDGLDLSAEGFPYMAVRNGAIAGIPSRILRVGFVGELGYEIHAPAALGEALWDALLEAGRRYRMRPFGVETQRMLRLEKGHIIIGQDTDGLTHPHEAGMGWALGRGKPFFLGQKAIEIRMRRPLARKLVGFAMRPQTATLPEECNLVIRGDEIVGRVTSIFRSQTLGKPIGLAYVAPDQAALGTSLTIKDSSGGFVEATVTATPFFDPQNRRQSL